MGPTTKTLRQRQHEATAEAMLDAAERALVRLGYDKATMQQIAGETGCAAGTFYLYFKNKQVLFETLVLRRLRGMDAAATEAMDHVQGPLDKIRQATAGILGYWQEHRPFLRLVFAVWPMRHRAMHDHLDEIGGKEHLVLRRAILGLLRQAQRQGLVRRDLPAETLLDFLEAVGFSLVEVFSSSPDRSSAREQERVLWGLVAGGLLHQE